MVGKNRVIAFQSDQWADVIEGLYLSHSYPWELLRAMASVFMCPLRPQLQPRR
jgi:hypothetical protein